MKKEKGYEEREMISSLLVLDLKEDTSEDFVKDVESKAFHRL